MKFNKAYFLDSETDLLIELSAAKRKQLEKIHPDWVTYTVDDDELQDVFEFFKVHGKIIAHPKFRNISCGITSR